MRAVESPESSVLAELQQRLLGDVIGTGRAEFAAAANLDVDLVASFLHALGFLVAQSDSAQYFEADLAAITAVTGLIEQGRLDQDLALAMTRAVARTTDRLTVWQTDLVAESLLTHGAAQADGGLDATTALRVAEQLTESAAAFEPLLIFAWRRHLLASLTRLVSDASPEDGASGPTRVVGFADLVNFSAMVRRATQKELAAMVMRFEQLASDIVTAHGGRVIKTVGDEVLFANTDPLAGSATALDLVAAMAEEKVLPQVRVGLAYGPVLSRLGDVFGTTVNRAARLTGLAQAGGVLADEALAARLTEVSGFQVTPTRRRHLRGVGMVTPAVITRLVGERRG